MSHFGKIMLFACILSGTLAVPYIAWADLVPRVDSNGSVMTGENGNVIYDDVDGGGFKSIELFANAIGGVIRGEPGAARDLVILIATTLVILGVLFFGFFRKHLGAFFRRVIPRC
jgi:hypothetical protein